MLHMATMATMTALQNVVLPCWRFNYTLGISPELANAAPACSWTDFEAHLANSGVSLFDGPMVDQSNCITTALTIVDALRLALGDGAYRVRRAPVVVDMVGWAFHWMPRREEDGTSHTMGVLPWDGALQRSTRRFWGTRIGDVLRAMLPLVERVTVRGYGPEAPLVEETPMRDDGWLRLELHPGPYSRMSEPPPTLTLLENSGMHDDLWPSDGGCISDKGDFPSFSHAELHRRITSGSTEGVGLGCFWRETVEMMRDSGRLIFATSYSSHEHLAAVTNLLGIGAEIVHAYANGFADEGAQVVHMDLLHPSGPLAASLRDSYPRPWGRKEGLYATTSALWRYRIEIGGWESLPALSRNRYVLSFQRGAAGAAQIAVDTTGAAVTPSVAAAASSAAASSSKSTAHAVYEDMWYAGNTAAVLLRRLQTQALTAADLPTMPLRQATILKEASWLKREGEGGEGGGDGVGNGGVGSASASASASTSASASASTSASTSTSASASISASTSRTARRPLRIARGQEAESYWWRAGLERDATLCPMSIKGCSMTRAPTHARHMRGAHTHIGGEEADVYVDDSSRAMSRRCRQAQNQARVRPC